MLYYQYSWGGGGGFGYNGKAFNQKPLLYFPAQLYKEKHRKLTLTNSQPILESNLLYMFSQSSESHRNHATNEKASKNVVNIYQLP